MSSVKLKLAPLKEVVFELHWNGEIDERATPFDKGFDLAQGKFADRLQAALPLHRQLLPEGLPMKVFGAPIHQYWAGELRWPVVQHGQGILTVNEVELGYEWLRYKALVINTVEQLIESYKDALTFSKVKLQYVDAWELEHEAAKDFVAKNLQTEVVTRYPPPGTLKGFNIQQQFNLGQASTMELNMSNGVNNKNQKESIVWSTAVTKQDALNFEALKIWIEFAHTVSSDFFKKMLNPTFYASLDG